MKDFIQAKTRAGFDSALSSGSITLEQIAFIEDTKEIWAKGLFYNCPYSKEQLEAIFFKIDNAPYIGDNGNWFINGQDSGKSSKGADGVSLGEIGLVQDFSTAEGSDNKVVSLKAVTLKFIDTTSEIYTNTGVNDYSKFSDATAYAIGDVVKKDGLLYKFTSAHTAGAWNAGEVEPTSIKSETDSKLSELENEIKYINKTYQQLFEKGSINSTSGNDFEDDYYFRSRLLINNKLSVSKIDNDIFDSVAPSFIYYDNYFNISSDINSPYVRMRLVFRKNGENILSDFSNFKYINFNNQLIEVSSYDVSKKIKELKSLIETQNKQLSKTDLDVSNLKEYSLLKKENYLEILEIETNQGYYKYYNGEFVSNENYISKKYDVTNINTIKVSSRLLGVNLQRVVCFNENNEYIKSLGEIGSSEADISSEIIQLSEDVKYIQCSGSKNSSVDAYKIEYEYININDGINQSSLYNKIIAGVGDSITFAKNGATINENDIYKPLNALGNKSHIYYLCKDNKARYYNYGVSGSTLTDITNKGISLDGFAKPNGRYTNMAEKLDYIVIMFGTNDSYYGWRYHRDLYAKQTYGDYYDNLSEENKELINSYKDLAAWRNDFLGTINSNDVTTWFGAANTVLSYLIGKYPLSKIVWVNCPTTDIYTEANISIAKKWGIPFLDTRSENAPLLWNKDTSFGQEDALINGKPVYQFRNTLFTHDGTHPNDDGYKYWYSFFSNFLNSI